MAAGKGFGTSPMGFNKNEVNEYIASLSKRINELETEKKELEKKYESVKNIVDGADQKVEQAEAAAKIKIEMLEEQIKSERKNSEDLINQVDELKRKLKNAGSAVNIAVGTSGNIAAAERQSVEIIANAEKTAKDTVTAANKTAEDIVAKAKKTAAEILQGTGGAGVDLSGFMSQLREFVDSVNAGCKALSDKASAISSGKDVEVTMPDFSAFVAPKADVPETNFNDYDFGAENNDSESESSGGIDEINALLASMAGDTGESSDDMSGDEMNGGFDFGSAEDTAGKTAEEPTEEKTEDTVEEPVEETAAESDMTDITDAEMTENEPEETEKPENENALDISLDDMLTGFEAEKTEDDSAEIKADFGDVVDANSIDFEESNAADEMAEMQKLLEQAELTFGGGSSEFEEKTAAQEEESASDDWSDLQNELNALEKQNGGFGSDVDMSDDSSDSNSDDDMSSDIWSLGDTDMSESDDDDMSSDLFGSF